MVDFLKYFSQLPLYVIDSFIAIPIITIPLLLLIIYGLTKKTIRHSHISKQRLVSDIHCRSCGNPMHEHDVFCKNCQTITPKVQEMLERNPNKKPDFYCNISNGYKVRCPHCKADYRLPGRYGNRYLGTPIICCTHCHNFFVDYIYTEWSVTTPFTKAQEFISIWFLALISSISLISLGSITAGDWTMAYDIMLLLLVLVGLYFVFTITRYIIVKRKQFRESNLRLMQNPEYPQILIDMGYWRLMSKEYYHLSKEPIVSQKNKLKELIKDAFTFD